MNIGKLLKMGLVWGVTIGLVSCANEGAGVVQESEELGVETEETGTFEGTTPMEEEPAYDYDADETTTTVALGVNADELYTDLTTTELYEGWDANDDNLLDENEYYGAFYDTWDINDDNMLDENEWNTALSDFGFDDNTAWGWSDWDTNNDNLIDENEFGTGLGTAGLFSDWDMNDDNVLEEREYTEGIFGLWNDADDDGILDENEYNDLYVRYFDMDVVQYNPERG
ncbi:hypothetical protein CLV24_11571 [Pontibacter ummariensis]|uniref:EF-hand domain-containing protein n=2 Tax=Pontibacter ummariensis TaxID=1610492 RepID=A0A239I0P2_9BACT|nr:hypothetical protein CLV24_11571 [Pontibacter ummariensis]SNS87031.1 hypothetical protein SAMN06296052_11571 [Pontibacter ummariensis]